MAPSGGKPTLNQWQPFSDNKRLRWYGHMLREEEKDTSNYAGKEKKAQKRWPDNIREDIKEYNVTEEMTQNRSVWHMKLKAGPLLHGGGLWVRMWSNTYDMDDEEGTYSEDESDSIVTSSLVGTETKSSHSKTK